MNFALGESRNGKCSSQQAGGGAIEENRPKEPPVAPGTGSRSCCSRGGVYKVGSAHTQLEAGRGATTGPGAAALSSTTALAGAEKYLHTEECLKSRECQPAGDLLCHKRHIIASLLPHHETFLRVYTVEGNLKL